jgi:UDP-N-acetylglucosamine:LPS N-acetylglucosamine transferase
MVEKAAIVYWCDGAGHAARSIPVAQELESRGVEVSVAGGGQGKPFVEMNGFEHPDLTTVAVKGSNPLAFLRHTLFDLAPSSVRRLRELNRWLKEEEPDVLVTDDIFAAVAATVQGVDFYRIDHLTPGMLDLRWDVLLRLYDRTSLAFCEGIIVTTLWEDEEAPDGFELVGPLAQEGEGEVEDYDVLLNPGTHGEDFGEIRRRLEERGYEVKLVGSDDWEIQPSMTPHTGAADCVVCTGYSSIADTVVAGTPCVVYPFLPFQKSLAEKAERNGTDGVVKADTVDEVVEAAVRCCDGEVEPPDYDNGAGDFVDVLLDS